MVTLNVLTDFSPAGANALRYAVLLTRHVMAHIHLVHVLPARGAAGAEFFQTPSLTLSVEQARAKLAARSNEISRYVPCSYEVVTDAPADALPTILGRNPLSVTVVGNNDPTRDTTDAWLSTALYLVRTQPQPLLVVPITHWATEAPRQIVFDTDGRFARLNSSAQALTELLSRLSRHGRPLSLSAAPDAVEKLLTKLVPAVVGIHVYATEHGPAEAAVADRISGSGLLQGVAYNVETTRYGCIESGILRAAAQHHAGLLAFVTRQLTFAGAEFFESVTAGLLTHSTIPVLTVPEAEPSLQPWLFLNKKV